MSNMILTQKQFVDVFDNDVCERQSILHGEKLRESRSIWEDLELMDPLEELVNIEDYINRGNII